MTTLANELFIVWLLEGTPEIFLRWVREVGRLGGGIILICCFDVFDLSDYCEPDRRLGLLPLLYLEPFELARERR